VPVAVVVNYETSLGFVPKDEHLAAMQAALERAGVKFIERGVRLGK
jgi:hypothetical protein